MIDPSSDHYTKGVSEGSRIRVTIECEGSNLDDVLMNIEQAIRACGFHPTGSICFMDDDL